MITKYQRTRLTSALDLAKGAATCIRGAASGNPHASAEADLSTLRALAAELVARLEKTLTKHPVRNISPPSAARNTEAA